jgi:hypothetical protein
MNNSTVCPIAGTMTSDRSSYPTGLTRSCGSAAGNRPVDPRTAKGPTPLALTPSVHWSTHPVLYDDGRVAA